MERRTRRLTVVILGLVAAGLSAAALSWACTPSAYIQLSPSSGGTGTAVTVTGQGFTPGPVVISLGDTTLATATGPDFSATVTVPDVSPGVHYVVATATAQDGRIEGREARAFRVTGPPAVAPAAGAGAPALAPSPAGAGRSQGAPSKVRATAPRVGSQAARPRAAPAAAAQATPTPAAVPTPARQAATGSAGSVPRSTPSARSASSDLWSGFATGQGAPSLSHAGGSAAVTGSWLLPSAVLGGLGSLVLLAGFGVALGRRRRRGLARTH